MENKTLRKYPDLIHYRRKQRAIPIVICAIYYAVIITIFACCYVLGYYEKHIVFYLIIATLLVLPLFLFKPFSFVFEKSYRGIISDKKFVNAQADTSTFGSSSAKYRYEKEIVCHSIKLENGKSIRYDVSNDIYDASNQRMRLNFGSLNRDGTNFEHGFPLITSALRDYYNIGDEVEHYAGFSYNRKTNLKQDEKNICIVCGALNLQKDDYCINCGHSLVK